MNVLIITIGSRDLQLNPEFKDQPEATQIKTYCPQNTDRLMFSSPRDGAKLLLDDQELFKKVQPYLEYPIIKPSLEHVKKYHKKIDKIILIPTDQPDKIDEKYRKMDTVNFAKLIQQLISDNFGRHIEIKTYSVKREVTDLDRTYHFFSKEFEKNNSPFRFKEGANIFLHAQGGIDAINFALLLKLIEYYPSVNQLHKPENSPVSSKLPFPQLFLKNLLNQKIQTALQHFHYNTVSAITTDSHVKLLAEYAEARIALNHDKAIKCIHELLEQDHHTDRSTYYDLIKPINSPDIKQLERELYNTAQIKFTQNSYADYIWRLFTIHDNLFIPHLEEYFKQKIVYNENSHHSEWNDMLSQYPEIQDFLDNRTVKARPLEWKKPSKLVYKAILEYIHKGTKNPKYVHEIHDLLMPIAELRNNIAHRYEGISLNDINKKLPKNKSVDDLHSLLGNYFGEPWGELTVYQQINELIEKKLKN